MSLYSHNGEWPRQLPNRIVLSNGMTRTDKTTYTPEEIADAGWVAVADPPELVYPNRLDWDGAGWIARAPNEAEIEAQWRAVREIRDTMLSHTDIDVLRAAEQGIPPAADVVAYRQALRDVPQAQTDPYNIVWPEPPAGAP
jgi:hypothetical protein